MTGLNHAATGIVIALIVQKPEYAVPLALLSHFVLDSIPHSTVSLDHRKTFIGYLVIEAFAMTVLTLLMMALFPSLWLAIGLCAVAAFLPDMLWPFFYSGRLRDRRGFRHFYSFHKAIQWSETHRGWVVEALYFTVLVIFFVDQHSAYAY